MYTSCTIMPVQGNKGLSCVDDSLYRYLLDSLTPSTTDIQANTLNTSKPYKHPPSKKNQLLYLSLINQNETKKKSRAQPRLADYY